MAELLEVKDLTVDFPTEDGIVHAVRGVSYDAGAGRGARHRRRVGLGQVGDARWPSWACCRKTAKVTGSVNFRGEELLGRAPRQLRSIRGQQDRHDLPGPDDVAEPGVHRRLAARRGACCTHRDVVQAAGVGTGPSSCSTWSASPSPAPRAKAYPHEFSGGMRQRAMIAMAIANDPDVIIADEPTTALDVTVQAQILETARDDQAARPSAAIILITHDLGVVAGMADRVMVMYAGTVGRVGHGRRRLLRAPHALHPRPARLAARGSTPGRRQARCPIRGAPPSLRQPPARLPVLAPLPAGPAGLPRRRARPWPPPTSVEHLASCLFCRRARRARRSAPCCSPRRAVP